MRALAVIARSMTRSVRLPQAWTETTRSFSERITSSRAPCLNSILPASFGQLARSVSWSLRAEGGIDRSTASAFGDVLSKSRSRAAVNPCPHAKSTTRLPRKRRRTLRATSHASKSSLRGRHAARQTVRPTLSKRVSPGKRNSSFSVSRFFEARFMGVEARSAS